MRGYRLLFTVMPPFFTHVIHWLRESQLKFYRRRSPSLCLPQIFLGPQMRGESGICPILDLLALTCLAYISGKIRFERRISTFPKSRFSTAQKAAFLGL